VSLRRLRRPAAVVDFVQIIGQVPRWWPGAVGLAPVVQSMETDWHGCPSISGGAWIENISNIQFSPGSSTTIIAMIVSTVRV